MKILGIETSCDETSVAIVEDGKNIIFSEVFSQQSIHSDYYGVVPELSARAHLEKIGFLIENSIRETKLSFNDIDVFAVTNRPGLIGSLITGITVAKVLSFLFSKPIIGIDHLLAHLYAVFLGKKEPEFPFIGLVVSGGHTLLFTVKSWEDIVVEGYTLDDAAGEAFDKVSKILGLGYPGGPFIDKIAKNGDPDSVKMPSVDMYEKNKDNFYFSYSGLKTAVLFYLKKNPSVRIEDLAASFQKSAVSVLYEKTLRLSRERKIPRIVVAGGVAANSLLRKLFIENIPSDTEVFLAEPSLCSDNAAMVAGLAYYYAKKSKFDDQTLNAYARSELFLKKGVKKDARKT